MDVDMVGWRNVKLESHFVVPEEQTLDVLHLRPGWTALRQRDADVIPSLVIAGDDAKNTPVLRHLDHEDATEVVTLLTVDRTLKVGSSIAVEQAKRLHNLIPTDFVDLSHLSTALSG